MPSAVEQLKYRQKVYDTCPNCGEHFVPYLRGEVQRSRRFLRVLWKRKYCAVICFMCYQRVGWEKP